MNRIAQLFSRLRSTNTKALIPYVTPEYPFKGLTLPLLQRLSAAGADMIEIGIPFSDPLADGKTIQHSSEIAIRHGVSVRVVLDIVSTFRTSHETPIALMGYMNPIIRYGMEKFLSDAQNAGVDGLIIPDLPPEEAEEFKQQADRVGMSTIFLIAPTTSFDRMKLIDRLSTDCSYCVSLTGVTGSRNQLGQNGSLRKFLGSVRSATTKPFIVGFGISNASQVRDVWSSADGAVVGSALIEAMGKAKNPGQALDEAEAFFRVLRSA